MRLTVVVAGALGNRPGNSGGAWVRSSWVDGLKQLGCDVFFVEQVSRDHSERARSFFDEVILDRGWTGRAALLDERLQSVAGAGAEEVGEWADRSDLLVNLSGHLRIPSLFERFKRRAFIDLDPGFTQMWEASGLTHHGFDGYDRHFTIGDAIGRPDCPIPTCGVKWVPVRQPVVLDDWPWTACPAAGPLTTVATWRGPAGAVDRRGRSYPGKLHEFRRFVSLPAMTGAPLELALTIESGDAGDRSLFENHGWSVVDAAMVVPTMDSFRAYTQRSVAEFSVAQGVYIETRCGWFSDRSVRYLATGRPVILQDTGFAEWLPTGEGVLCFRDLKEAADAIDAVRRDGARHGRAARALGERYFDARRVLSNFLDQALD